MEAVWILGGAKHSRLYINARAATIAVGPAEMANYDKLFPMVAISYPFEEFAMVTTLANAMKKVGAEPVVHLWDLSVPEPEVAIHFGIQRPDLYVLQTLGVGWHDPTQESIADIVGCTEVFTLAEANTIRKQAAEFMELFHRIGAVVVGIGEETSEESSLFLPTVQFVAHTVVNTPPRMEA